MLSPPPNYLYTQVTFYPEIAVTPLAGHGPEIQQIVEIELVHASIVI